jgi:MYXO-CTERM domain-containing protein
MLANCTRVTKIGDHPTMRKLQRLTVAASLAFALPLLAAAAPAGAQAPSAAPTDTPIATDTAAPQTVATANNQPFDYGLLGLVGLLGLAGLMRRQPSSTVTYAPPSQP